MLSVILIWSYILITTFLLGWGIGALTERLFDYKITDPISICFAGIAAATVYAQFFSLIGKVGLVANSVMLLVCIGIFVVNRKKIGLFWKEVLQSLPNNPQCGMGKGKLQNGNEASKNSGGASKTLSLLGLGLLVLVMAYGSSRGYIHYDTSLYHAQSIRWIEEYGVVRGLGNLHCRLAYNSASFALSALYSVAFLGGQSYHTVAGFMALLLAMECLHIAKIRTRKMLVISDFARFMAIYYLLNIYDEMVSPASDYFMVITAFFLVIRWISLLEAQEKRSIPYGLLCVLGVFLITIKLSAALILLLVCKPMLQMIREKKGKEILFCLITGFLTALPYFARNVVISGWLVYPFTAIDLFPVTWKIPKGLADYDSHEIQVWGRGYSDVTRYHIGISEWIGDWFAKQSGMDKLFILAAMMSCVLVVIQLLIIVLRSRSAGKDGCDAQNNLTAYSLDSLLVNGVLAICFLFWLLTSPLIRYGCVYVYVTAAVIGGSFWITFIRKPILQKILYGALLVFGLYKAVMFGKEFVVGFQNAYWIWQKDYENHPVQSIVEQGVTIYIPVEGDQTGYDSFPSTPSKEGFVLRGENLSDGFLPKQ